MNALGTDVCKYESPANFALGYQRGLRFAYVRVSVGDYYTDPELRNLWNGYKSVGCLVGGYLVTAPRDSGGIRRITAQAHLDLFVKATQGLVPELPWVVDAELQRGETNAYITQLHKDVVNGVCNLQECYPVIYTRQSWWDTYVNADPLWAQCDLFAARYKSTLNSPWSDGYCKFRDWKDWKFWQKTATADGAFWGMNDKEADLDDFNGNEAQLYEYAKKPKPLSLEETVSILIREAKLHGWNLTA